MSGAPNGRNSDHRRPLLLRIDEVCDRFEAAWISGGSPQIEDYLAGVDEAVRLELLRELLWIELERLGHAGERARLESYLRRFPQANDVIRDVFRHAETLAVMAGSPSFRVLPDGGGCDRVTTTESFSLSGTEPIQQGRDVGANRGTIPRKINRYRVRSLLGTGSYGSVFLAYDELIQRLVAIKVLHFFCLNTPEAAETLLTEARCLGRLEHPAILPVFDAGQMEDGRCYIVSRYIQGETLAARMAAGRMSPGQAAELVALIAEALHCAHRKDLVHRDVKPANILLGENERPYIGDFGLAVRYGDPGQGESLVGTPAYMSPEQAAGQSHLVDGRCDIFSLGVVFYELLTGVRPFHGDSVEQLIQRVISLEARPPRQIDDSIPLELERICLKAMSKKITDRYTTALDMAAELRAFLGQPGAPGPTGRSAPAPDDQQSDACLDENVQFTVYRPQVVEPARWYPLVVFAHLSELPPDAPEGVSDPIEEVRRQAAKSLGPLAEQYRDVTQDSRSAVPREGELTLVPEVPGVEFNPGRRTFVWQEAVHREEFRLRASSQLEGRVVRGRLTIFLGAVLLADVSLSMRVTSRAVLQSEESTTAVARARRYRRIFVSCSPEDVDIVSQFERYARALGDEYYTACRALRLAPQLAPRPEELIRRSDVFQLFWSWNSMRSPAVRREWEYALSLNRDGFIRPVFWETPLPADEPNRLPPESLRRLGFQQIGGHATGPALVESSSRSDLREQPAKCPPSDERERKGGHRDWRRGSADRAAKTRSWGRRAPPATYRGLRLPGADLIGRLFGALTGARRPRPEPPAPEPPPISPTISPPRQPPQDNLPDVMIQATLSASSPEEFECPPDNLLDSVIQATPAREPMSIRERVDALVAQAVHGPIVWNEDVEWTIAAALQKLDPSIPEQRELIERLRALQQMEAGAELEQTLDCLLAGPKLDALSEEILGTAGTDPLPAHMRLDRVRSPRAHLSYAVEENGVIRLRELPLVIGVLGNFSGDPQRELPRENRPFHEVDRDNFCEVFRQIGPSLTLDMSGVLPDHPGGYSVRLEFRSLADFGPDAAALRVQPMAAMFARRAALLSEGRDVAEIERRICRLWEAIVGAPEFQRLEAAWRGLHLLVTNAETGVMLKIKVLDIRKEELAEDLVEAGETNQSRLFRLVYGDPLATPSGEPFAALIGDYEFSHQPDDVALLEKMAQLGSLAFCPFLAAASPRLCGINGWNEFNRLGDRRAVASGSEYARWNALRTSEAARFVYLTAPRVAARLPCLALAEKARNLGFQESGPGENPVAAPAPSNVYCWTNSAYVVGMRLADSFARAGHCMAAWESGGGTMEGSAGGNLTGGQDDLGRASRIEVGVTGEVSLTGEQVDRLLFLGLAPLRDPKHAGHAMPGGLPSIQRVTGGLAKEEVSDGFLTGRLQYVMAVSRLAHYLMLIVRDGFAKSVPWEECQESLRRWIAPCVDYSGPPTPKMATKILLRESRIIIRARAETPEQGQIVAWLHPWLPDLQLSRPQRMTMQIPRLSK